MAAVVAVVLLGPVPSKTSALAGGSPVMPCYNCKFGFIWLDSDSTSGKLQVSKKCRANRKLALFGTSLGNSSGSLSRLDRTSSDRRGNWDLSFTGPRLLVIELAPKTVRGTTCAGASAAFAGGT